MTAPVTANVCRECDGTGRAALESDGRGNHQMGDCPRCTKRCCICSDVKFKIELEQGACATCLAGDYPMSQAGAQL